MVWSLMSNLLLFEQVLVSTTKQENSKRGVQINILDVHYSFKNFVSCFSKSIFVRPNLSVCFEAFFNRYSPSNVFVRGSRDVYGN